MRRLRMPIIYRHGIMYNAWSERCRQKRMRQIRETRSNFEDDGLTVEEFLGTLMGSDAPSTDAGYSSLDDDSPTPIPRADDGLLYAYADGAAPSSDISSAHVYDDGKENGDDYYGQEYHDGYDGKNDEKIESLPVSQDYPQIATMKSTKGLRGNPPPPPRVN